MARGQRENVAECNDHGSNPVQGTIFCFHFYCLRLTRLLINPRNIISNIIMIFNINSTRGHTGSLLVCIIITIFAYIMFVFFIRPNVVYECIVLTSVEINVLLSPYVLRHDDNLDVTKIVIVGGTREVMGNVPAHKLKKISNFSCRKRKR